MAAGGEAGGELGQMLGALGITSADMRFAVMLLVATARQRRETVAIIGPGGGTAHGVEPLPTADTVRQLNQRLTSLEQRLESFEQRVRETNEKLDRVLTALGSG